MCNKVLQVRGRVMIGYLESLFVFTKVVEHKSFTTAARSLQMSPSMVSKHISRLELHLGTALFARSTRNLNLTEAGSDLYRRSRSAITELQDARATIKAAGAGVTGSLRVHITPGIGQRLVEPSLLRFIALHRDIALQVSMSAEIINPLDHGLDLVIRSGAPDDAHMRHNSLSFREFGPLRYLICAAPGYLRQHGLPQAPSDLARHNCLIHSTQVSAVEWRFRSPAGDEYTVPVSGSVISNSHTIIYGAALAGIGIARLLTASDGDRRELAALTCLFEEETVSHRIIRAFYPRSSQTSQKVVAFLDFLSRDPAGPL
jgi:DNA-binding transcriptional LysR family regulator